jgi:3-oxoacyl-[acyl-carrier-protein] synthase-1
MQAHPDTFRNHECGAVTDLVQQFYGLGGFTTTISTACSSSANSIMMAARMIRAGHCDAAIAGGADGLCRFTLNGFNTLGILDRQECQPFDAARRGLNLGEGAGYLLLVNEESLRLLNLEPLALVTGWANSNDAYHQTASSPDGAGNTLAMQSALQVARLSPEDISAINLHGTGTANNDSAEGRAIDTVFGSSVPPATSTKSFTGHTLGAAAGVEAVFSVLSLQHNALPATLRWTTPMEDTTVRPVTSLLQQPFQHILSNSFGFGGNCSSLIFSAAS